MGYSTTKIPFMILDETKIEVQSATHAKHFELKTLNDFANFRGGFVKTDKPDHAYIFEFETGDFIEFVIPNQIIY